MDQRLLQSFMAVYRSRNITEAARRLNVTQPTLSRRLRDFHERLGIVLFRPDGRGIAPTPDADRIVPHVVSALDALARLQDAATGAPATRISLSLAATAQLIESSLAADIVAHAERHPETQVRLVDAGAAQVPDMVRSGRISVGLTSTPAFESGLASTFVRRLQILAIAPHLGARRQIEIAEVARHPLLLLDRRFQSRVTFDAALQIGRLPAEVAFESGSTQAVLMMAEQGFGIAVVPSSIPPRDRAARVTLNGDPIEIELSAIWDPADPQAPQIEALVDFLAQRQALAAAAWDMADAP